MEFLKYRLNLAKWERALAIYKIASIVLGES